MNNTRPGNGPIRFGPFEFEPATLELRRRGIPVRVQGQPLQVLARLVTRPGALVTRDDLRRALWPDGTYVDFEHALNAAVRRLRRALEDDASEPQFIQTLARRGYRFAAPVEPPTYERPSSEPRHSSLALAVLPFANLAGDEESECLTEGITERLINELALIHDLRVIARSAVVRYKGSQDPVAIGRSLGVNAIVIGTVSRRADKVLSIHAELVDGVHGFQLWGRSYERSPEDVTRLEQEIIRDIRTALPVRLTTAELRRLRKPETTSAAAHREYLKGRHFLNQMNEGAIRRAIGHFTAATEEDRGYALAYCGLADCYSLFAFMGLEAPDVVLPKARNAARTALRLDDELAEAHASVASLAKVYEWDWDRAEVGYRRALDLNPSYAAALRWYAAHLAAMDRRDEALAAIERASELDPVSPIIANELAWHAYMARDYDRARSHAVAALELQPGFTAALFGLGLACEQLGAHEEALEAFRRAEVHSPNPAVIASEAHLLAVMGRRDEALQQRARLEQWSRERYVAAYWFAMIAAGLGERQVGLTWLERAVDQHDVWLVWLKTEPRLDAFRAEPRFRRVLDRVGLGDAGARGQSAESEPAEQSA